jgi:two-component system, OmpR family, KDP operon response regulator KdpE
MTDPIVSIVLIEDDKHIRRYVRSSLESEATRVLDVDTGEQGIAVVASIKPDLLIVDLGLPDLDGLDVIRRVRGWSAVPILVLSGRTREDQKVAALDAGADDYVTKPFGVAELAARIRALLRRWDQPAMADSPKVSFGSITVDLAAHLVQCDSEVIHLTPIEYRLLAALIRHAGCVLTQRQLLLEVWGAAHADSAHYVRIYMAHLRHKLERNPAQPEYILTETGVGYRLIGIR